MAGTRLKLCLDSCIFLMREGDNTYERQVRLAVEDIFHRFDMNQLDILTSSLTVAEVLAAKSPDTFDYLSRARGKRNFLYVNCDHVIARIASDLRQRYKTDSKNFHGDWIMKTISTPDAIHLASAIVHQFDEFITVDDRSDYQTRGLLGLGSVEYKGHVVKIREPYIAHPILPYGQDVEPTQDEIPTEDEQVADPN